MSRATVLSTWVLVAASCASEEARQDDGDTNSFDDGDKGGIGDQSCLTTIACEEHNYVCWEGLCYHPDDLYFETRVHMLTPSSSSCADELGTSEIFFTFDYDDYEWEDVQSPFSTCPGEWSTFAFTYDSLRSFRLEFWKTDDRVIAESITLLSWWDGNVDPPVPDYLLHDGGYEGYDPLNFSDYWIEVEFQPCGTTLVGCP